MPSIQAVGRLIEEGAWDDLRRLIRSGPSRHIFLSTAFNERGMNAFHMACADDELPPDVFDAILEADRNHLYVVTNNSDRATPLHYACETGSARTVHALLRRMDYNARDQIEKKDGNGNTALEVVWYRNVIPGFVSYGKEVTEDEDVEDSIREWSHTKSRFHLDLLQLDCWKKTTYLLFSADTGEGRSEEVFFPGTWNIVHCIARGESLKGRSKPFTFRPSIFLWLALKQFPEQVKWPDEAGNFPLHVAAKGRALTKLFDDISVLSVDDETKSILEETQATSIEMLVKIYPRASRIPEHSGRLPLHLAAESGKEWDGEVEPLVEAAPNAVETRDVQTHLYPFMLAAEGKKSSLDSTFMLLKASPSLVRTGIKMTAYESYLERKRADDHRRYLEEIGRKNSLIAELQTLLKKRKRAEC